MSLILSLAVDKGEGGHLDGPVVEVEGVASGGVEDVEGVAEKRYLQKILMLIWRSIIQRQWN